MVSALQNARSYTPQRIQDDSCIGNVSQQGGCLVRRTGSQGTIAATNQKEFDSQLSKTTSLAASWLAVGKDKEQNSCREEVKMSQRQRGRSFSPAGPLCPPDNFSPATGREDGKGFARHCLNSEPPLANSKVEEFKRFSNDFFSLFEDYSSMVKSNVTAPSLVRFSTAMKLISNAFNRIDWNRLSEMRRAQTLGLHILNHLKFLEYEDLILLCEEVKTTTSFHPFVKGWNLARRCALENSEDEADSFPVTGLFCSACLVAAIGIAHLYAGGLRILEGDGGPLEFLSFAGAVGGLAYAATELVHFVNLPEAIRNTIPPELSITSLSH